MDKEGHACENCEKEEAPNPNTWVSLSQIMRRWALFTSEKRARVNFVKKIKIYEINFKCNVDLLFSDL